MFWLCKIVCFSPKMVFTYELLSFCSHWFPWLELLLPCHPPNTFLKFSIPSPSLTYQYKSPILCPLLASFSYWHLLQFIISPSPSWYCQCLDGKCYLPLCFEFKTSDSESRFYYLQMIWPKTSQSLLSTVSLSGEWQKNEDFMWKQRNNQL